MLPRKRLSTLKWLARIHLGVLLFSFFAYLGLGFFLGPEFLYQDIRQKFFAFADDTIVVTAIVPGPPAIPALSATPTCVAGAPRIILDWADDSGSTSFDIERDALPLTTGLNVSGYTDTAVTLNTTYAYQVTATGPMFPGTATSAVVSATTLDCAALTPVTVSIETLGGKNVTTDRSDVELNRFRPHVTGTSSIPYAIIDILVTNPTLRARVIANVNGYFEWIPPMKLDKGRHIIEVTATDPGDLSRTAVDSFVFQTKHGSDDGQATRAGNQEMFMPVDEVPVDFLVVIKNAEPSIAQDDLLHVGLSTQNSIFPEDATANVFLNDPSRQDVLRFSKVPKISGQSEIEFSERLPLYLEPGTYRVRADVTSGGEVVSREAQFLLQARPLFSIAGHEVSYVEAATYIGFFFFSLLFLFLFFLLFFIREYWLSLHSLRSITERQLMRFGLIGKRKGVIR
ncbi:MAG: hypothetical protein ACEQSB_04215 [Undibacterium sp.]